MSRENKHAEGLAVSSIRVTNSHVHSCLHFDSVTYEHNDSRSAYIFEM